MQDDRISFNAFFTQAALYELKLRAYRRSLGSKKKVTLLAISFSGILPKVIIKRTADIMWIQKVSSLALENRQLLFA